MPNSVGDPGDLGAFGASMDLAGRGLETLKEVYGENSAWTRTMARYSRATRELHEKIPLFMRLQWIQDRLWAETHVSQRDGKDVSPFLANWAYSRVDTTYRRVDGSDEPMFVWEAVQTPRGVVKRIRMLDGVEENPSKFFSALQHLVNEPVHSFCQDDKSVPGSGPNIESRGAKCIGSTRRTA